MKNNVETLTPTETLSDVLSQLGIKKSNDSPHNLLIWNDDHNDMLWVVTSLIEVCKLKPDECVKIMLEAHIKGKAIAKTGSFEEMVGMKKQLNVRGIEATVESNN